MNDARLWHPWLRINRVLRATGTGWARTPWHAMQRATWEALMKAEDLSC